MARRANWSRKIEDMIFHIYYMYGCKNQVKQMEKLKSICMNEINLHTGLKKTLTDDKSIEYFIIQLALENIESIKQ